MIRVVCWKWNNGIHPKKKLQFTAEHVNRLRNMVSRNLHMPHEFICITDDPVGIAPGIRIIPLWDDLRDMGGCYVRLKAFAEEMTQLIGERFIWLDLDAVIVDDITPIIDKPHQFMMWGDTHPLTPYNGSMVMMTAGSRKQVWEKFDRDESPKKARNKGFVGTDQAWIGTCLGPNEKKWSVADGVYSFRVHIRKQGTNELPAGAKIIFFHGSTDPSQPKIQEQYPWIGEHWR